MAESRWRFVCLLVKAPPPYQALSYDSDWTGLEFGESQRAVENREKWRKVVVELSLIHI